MNGLSEKSINNRRNIIPKTTAAAGILLRQYLEFGLYGYKDILNGYLKEVAEGIEVVRAGQGLALLPLIDSLRSIETEVLLQGSNRHTPGFPQLGDVPASGDHVDDGEVFDAHEATSFSAVGRAVFGQEYFYTRNQNQNQE